MAFDDIRLYRGMYSVVNKSFSEVLEELDPDDLYKGTDLESLDAYERQLKRFNIKVSGYEADIIEKFFMNSETAILFPEFMARAVKKGVIESDMLNLIICARSKIRSLDYRPITLIPQIPPNTDPIAEAQEIPALDIRTKSVIVNLTKHGKLISASFETLRFQNLEVFGVILQKIGRDIAYEELNEAYKVLTDNAATIDVSGAGALTYENLLTFWENLAPYQLNTMMANTATIHKILSIPEMKDSLSGLDFQASGKIVTPLGANLIRCEAVEDNQIIGFDRTCALQMIKHGDIFIDYDKVINRQIDRSTITINTGFNKLFDDAVKKLLY